MKKKNIIKEWNEIDRVSQICLWFVFDYFSSFLLTFCCVRESHRLLPFLLWFHENCVCVFVCRMYFHFHAKCVFLKSFISSKKKIMCVFDLYQNQVRLDLVFFIHLPSCSYICHLYASSSCEKSQSNFEN